MARNPTPAPLTAEREAAIRASRYLFECTEVHPETCDCDRHVLLRALDAARAARDALAREVETLRRERDRLAASWDALYQRACEAGGEVKDCQLGRCGRAAAEQRAEAAEARLREAADTCPVCASVRDHRVGEEG